MVWGRADIKAFHPGPPRCFWNFLLRRNDLCPPRNFCRPPHSPPLADHFVGEFLVGATSAPAAPLKLNVSSPSLLPGSFPTRPRFPGVFQFRETGCKWWDILPSVRGEENGDLGRKQWGTMNRSSPFPLNAFQVEAKSLLLAQCSKDPFAS